MPRNVFKSELQELSDRLITMGDAISYRIEKVAEVLKTGETLVMKEVAGGDDEIDDMEHDNERFCLRLIIEQQPMAGDLRFIASSLKILTDMEREADQCADICKLLMSGEFRPGTLKIEAVLVDAVQTVYKMFTGAMDSFLNADVDAAGKIIAMDDIVDDAFEQCVASLAQTITEDSSLAKESVDMLFIAKYVERMGDHATNIAEWAQYMVTGENIRS